RRRHTRFSRDWSSDVCSSDLGQTGLPVQMRYNMPIEIFYTVVPFILIIGFFAFTARDQAAIEEDPGNPDVRIEAFGKRWAWDFRSEERRVGKECRSRRAAPHQ